MPPPPRPPVRSTIATTAFLAVTGPTTTVMGTAATSALPTLGRNIVGATTASRANIITRLAEAGSVPAGRYAVGLSADDAMNQTYKAASVGGLFHSARL